MEMILVRWPYAGLALAAVLVGWSVSERRPAGAPPRWRDPAFLLPLLWPMYLLHQFEEHGVDVLGRPYAFLGAMCRTLGFAELAGCPADEAFIFVVNVIACPLAFALPYLFRRTRPALAAMGWGIPLVNALSHVGTAVRSGEYNPGLLTAVALFIPLGWWVMIVLVRARALTVPRLGLVVLSGVVVHVVLFGSLQLRGRGLLGEAALLAVNGLNGLVPLALGWWPSRRSPAPG